MPGKPDRVDLEQWLSSYIDGTCSEPERKQVEEALRRDPQLAALHQQLRRTVDALRAVQGEAAPSHVRERILSQLERRALIGLSPGASQAAAVGSHARTRRNTPWLGLLAAAMLVAAVGTTYWVQTHQARQSRQVAMAPPPRPVLADRARQGVDDKAKSAKSPEPMPGEALAMREQNQPAFGGASGEPRRDTAEARPTSSEVSPAESAPSADAMPAAPAGAQEKATSLAATASAASPATDGLGVNLSEGALAQNEPAQTAGTDSRQAGGTRSVPLERSAVVRLQVAVADPDKVVEMAEIVRHLVEQRGGQILRTASQAGRLTLMASVPAAQRPDLDRAIAGVPAVAYLQSQTLAAGEPEAREATQLVSQRWLGSAQQLLTALDLNGRGQAASPELLASAKDQYVAQGNLSASPAAAPASQPMHSYFGLPQMLQPAESSQEPIIIVIQAAALSSPPAGQ